MEDSRKLSRVKKVITISPSFTSYRRENGYPGDMRHSGACCRGAGNAWLLRATAFLALLEKTAIKGPLTPRRPGAMTDGTFSKTLVFHCDPGCKSQGRLPRCCREGAESVDWCSLQIKPVRVENR